MSAVLKRHYSNKPLLMGKAHYQMKVVVIEGVRVKIEWYRFKEIVTASIDGEVKMSLNFGTGNMLMELELDGKDGRLHNGIMEALHSYRWTEAKYRHDPRLRFKKLRIAPAGRQKKAGDFL